MRVDGVSYNIDWARFKVGCSFFIPVLNAEDAKARVQEVADRLEFAVAMKIVIEEGIRGLRVWRVR